MSDITDGLSNTLLAGEVNGNFKPWGYPANWRDPALGINKSPDGFGSPWRRRKGANFLFADGSIHFIQDDIDPVILKALSTPDGGETSNSDDF
jgi:prepilin-type processing-associated H-X9-DG protein